MCTKRIADALAQVETLVEARAEPRHAFPAAGFVYVRDHDAAAEAEVNESGEGVGGCEASTLGLPGEGP